MSTLRKTISLILCVSALAFGQENKHRPEDLVIESIECSGNERTSCDTIKQSIHLKSGEKVNEEEIENSRIRLSVTGKYETVELSLKKGSSPGKAVLLVSVKEAPSLYNSLSSGFMRFGDRNSVVVDTTVGTRDFLGKGKSFQGSARVQKNVSNERDERIAGRVDYIDPHLGGSADYFLTGTLGYTNWREVDVTNVGYFNLEAGKRVLDFSSLYLGVLGTRSNLFLSTGPKYSLLPYAAYGWNSEDHPSFPRSGSSFRTALGAFVGRDSDLYIDLGYRKHIPIGDRSVVTLNFLGYGFLSLTDRLYTLPLEGEHPAISVRYAYDFGRGSNSSGNIVRAYVEPGMTGYYQRTRYQWGYSSGGIGATPTIKTGVMFPSDLFGTVNLFFVYGSTGAR